MLALIPLSSRGWAMVCGCLISTSYFLFVITDNNVGLGLPRRVGPRHGLAGIWWTYCLRTGCVGTEGHRGAQRGTARMETRILWKMSWGSERMRANVSRLCSFHHSGSSNMTCLCGLRPGTWLEYFFIRTMNSFVDQTNQNVTGCWSGLLKFMVVVRKTLPVSLCVFLSSLAASSKRTFFYPRSL